MILRRYSSLILSVMLFFVSIKMEAQDYYCITVDSASGMISVITHPVDYTAVTQYDIDYRVYSGSIGGAFSVSPTGPEDIYTIPATNGNNIRYRVDVIFRPASASPYGHAISSLKLAVSALSTSIAKLDWNPIDTAVPGTFYIERYEAPTWKLLKSFPYTTGVISLTYNDTVTYPFCNLGPVYYRVAFDQFPGVSGCRSVSNIDSDNFEDQAQPEMPVNDTVSILPNTIGSSYSVVLGWTESPSTDVVGYKIFRAVSSTGIFDSIGYVNTGITQYVDATADPCNDHQEYYYAIVSTDGCKNSSANIFHAISPHNLVLTVSDIDPCERKVQLNWNSYENMPGGLGGYYVFRQVNSGSFTNIADLGNTITSFEDSLKFVNGFDYSYYVMAYSQTNLGSSTSCIERKKYNGPVTPDSIYIVQATVVSNQFVEVTYYYTPPNTVSELVLERADVPSGPFIPVDTLTGSGTGFLPQQYILNDYSADVQNRSYYYRIVVIDDCDKAAVYSVNMARTIMLTVVPFGTNSNQLDWNGYDTWLQSVSGYEIYRKVNGVLSPAGPLSTIYSPPFEYFDDLNALIPTAEGCYYIKAVENTGNPYVSGAFSISNEVCSIRDPIFMMPTAFCPDGYNNKFRPKSAFVDSEGFSMKIFNRWGQLIFETNDMFNGWDGRANGIAAPTGLYMYKVTYKSSQGDTFEQKGLLTLVR
jgi:gliding motility-associated-like protein